MNISLLPEELQLTCQRVSVVIDEGDALQLSLDSLNSDAEIHVHVYRLSEEEPAVEELEPTSGDDEWTAGCDNTSLPHKTLDGVWDSLILAPGLKRHLLEYAQSALLFSDKGVSPHIVTWNRLILLHGPVPFLGTSVGHSSQSSLFFFHTIGDSFAFSILKMVFDKWETY